MSATNPTRRDLLTVGGFVATAGAAVVVHAAMSRTPYEKGRRAAAADVVRGRLAVTAYGKPSLSAFRYDHLLKARYAVETDIVGGCYVDKETNEHARGYNEVTCAAIKDRYGQDVFEECARDARAADGVGADGVITLPLLARGPQVDDELPDVLGVRALHAGRP